MKIKILDLNFNAVIKTAIIKSAYELAVIMYAKYGEERYGKDESRFSRMYSDLETTRMCNDMDYSGVIIVNCD